MAYQITNSYTLSKLDLVKTFAGYSKKKSSVPGNQISLIGAFETLCIYHDIDEIATSGYVTVKEQGNLIKFFPIIGWERIDIEFSISLSSESGNTGTHLYEPYKRSFFVYAVDQMADQGDTKMYTLRFADISALINVASRLETRYTGKAEDIISKVCSTDMFMNHGINTGTSTAAMPLQIATSTQFELDVISPCWKPFDFIKRIASLAVSSGGTFNDCLFFQQTNGIFTFTDYKTIMNSVPLEFIKRPSVKPEVEPGAKYTIKNFILNKLYNTQSQSAIGMFGIMSKIFDFSNMSLHSFANYYYQGDTTTSTPEYSAIKVDEITTTENTPGYIDSMMSPYYPKNAAITGNPRFNSIKQSPVSCINISGCGFDQSSVLKMSGTTNVVSGETAAFQTPRFSVANGIPCNLNMRAKRVIFEMNPCTDLKLGQTVVLNMDTVSSEKSDVRGIEEFLNGVWYIGKLQYQLTSSEITVNAECFTNSLGIA